MNSATNNKFKDEASFGESTQYTKPHLALVSKIELETPKLVDGHRWELEEEHAVILSNN